MTSLVSAGLLLLLASARCQEPSKSSDDAKVIIEGEMKNAMTAITGRFDSQFSQLQDEIQNSLSAVLRGLGGGLSELNLDLVGDGSNFSTSAVYPPQMNLGFTPELLDAIGQNITEAIKENVVVAVDEALDKHIANLTQKQNAEVLAAIKNLDETYSKHYKKLFHFTKEQLDLISHKIDAINGTANLSSSPCIDKKKVPRDCAEAQKQGRHTGVTLIHVESMDEHQEVWCDQDTDGGGWTVFLQRLPTMKGDPLNFKKSYAEYENPFGDASGEYWLGLLTLRQMTVNSNQMLRVDIRKDDETAFSVWDKFTVGNPLDLYRLGVEGFHSDSTAGDAMEYHNDMQFSAYDDDNDKASGGSCSQWSGEGGWWYNYCYYSNPTGIYPPSDLAKDAEADHFLEWRKWQGYYVYLTHLSMKIRPYQP